MTSGIQVRDSTLKIGIPFTVWHFCESLRCARLPCGSIPVLTKPSLA
jgi:hypothetical protein